MDGTRPQLAYAPREESPHHPITARVATLLSMGVLLAVASLWVPRWWHAVRIVYLERQCLSYRMHGETICQLDRAGAPQGLTPAPVSPPECWTRFYSLLTGSGFKSDGTVFLHERFTPAGAPRLVAVDALIVPPSPTGSAVSFRAHCFSPSKGFTVPQELSSTLHGGDAGPGFVTWNDSIKIFAGKTDAANPSHFTIDLEIDGRRSIIDGWIINGDDNVVLQLREDLLTPPLQPSWASPR